MSRIGKKPIRIPEDISVNIEGNVVAFKKGNSEKRYNIDRRLNIVFENGELKLLKKNKTDKTDDIIGTDRSNLNNLVSGLKDGFSITLEMKGVGFKASVSGDFLVLSLGHSHDIAYTIKEGIQIKTEKPNLIIVSGDSKQKVGQVASEIINFRPTEPYKGKGVKIQGAWVLRKEGKKK